MKLFFETFCYWISKINVKLRQKRLKPKPRVIKVDQSTAISPMMNQETLASLVNQGRAFPKNTPYDPSLTSNKDNG